MSNLPEHVQIEINNTCNSKCIICPLKSMKRKPEIMDFELFKKIVNELRDKDYSGTISPFGVGEPFMVPNILDYLRYIRRNVPKAYIRLYTNASKLNPELSEAIIREGMLDRLAVSFDGGTKEAYESVRIGLSFDEVRNNVHNFIKIRNTLVLKKPVVEITMTVTRKSLWVDKSNKNTIEEIQKEFKDADAITFHKYFEASVPGTKKWVYNPLPRNSKIKNIFKKRNFCNYLECMTILSNGFVGMCCADYEGKMPLGNMRGNTIEEVWNGEKLKTIKDDLKHRRFEKLPLCANCDCIEQNIVYRQGVKMLSFLQKHPRLYKRLQIFYATRG